MSASSRKPSIVIRDGLQPFNQFVTKLRTVTITDQTGKELELIKHSNELTRLANQIFEDEICQFEKRLAPEAEAQENTPAFAKNQEKDKAAAAMFALNKSIEAAINAYNSTDFSAKDLNTENLDAAIVTLRDNLKTVNDQFGGMSKTVLLVGLLIAGLAVGAALHFQAASYLAGIFGPKLAEAITYVAATSPFTVPLVISAFTGFKPGFYGKSQDLVTQLEKHQPWCGPEKPVASSSASSL